MAKRTTVRDNTTSEMALRYAAAGRKVLPLHNVDTQGCTCRKRGCLSAGKHPRVNHGAYDASSDPEVVRGWFERWPAANLGMTLENLVVVDIDPRNAGDATFARLIAEHGQLAETW